MDEIAVSLSNIAKCYKTYLRPVDRLKEIIWPQRNFAQVFWALRDINIQIPQGKTVGIIGRNGSGKSTLLQIIAGTVTPTTGTVQVRGRIGALLELGSGFNPEFTGRENVFLNGAILGISREEMEQKFGAIAQFADIADFIDLPVKTYSSGMMMRLAFAVSVNLEPEVLIIDEALSVGDAAFQFKCFERLEKLTASGVTTLIVSHDIKTVKTFCDHVIYLSKGVEVAAGAPEDIAEMYFLDLRDEQRRAMADQTVVKTKAPVNTQQKAAFGTDEGQIIQASFTDTQATSSVFTAEDTVEVEVVVEFSNGLKYPALCLMVLDRKSIPLSGKYIPLIKTTPEQKNSQAKVRFTFPCRLAEGNYFITLRLENRQSDKTSFLVDKQSGVLHFEVMRTTDKKFLGIVDLGIEADIQE
jgi:lipopolysaccharide transport system ATP-binding protein